MPAKAASLVHTDFPLYTINMVGDKHFMVAGGGGSAKTGVTNAIVSETERPIDPQMKPYCIETISILAHMYRHTYSYSASPVIVHQCNIGLW